MIFSKLNISIRNPGATNDEISTVELELNVKIPKIYKGFLNLINGLLTDEGILLYGTTEILERNLTWEVKEYAEGYIAIGDDRSGTVLLMPEENESTKIIAVDSGDMNPSNGRRVTSNFLEWVKSGCVIN